MPESIILRGVRQNNLKNLDLDLPLGKLIVVTGLSGTGKSSLVFDTLHAEGQRRYVETFSPYVRQFMEMMDRPKVDRIENIRPSIAIEQSNTVRTSRSTVGTMTELTDYFKVWFCHHAKLFDPETGEQVEEDSPQTIWSKVQAQHPGQTVLITFAVRRPAKLQWDEILAPIKGQGYTRILVDGVIQRLDEIDPDSLAADATLYVIQDRITLPGNSKPDPKTRDRFIESARAALHFGDSEMQLFNGEGGFVDHYSEGLHNPKTGRHFRPAIPNLFSFNSPIGACPRCRGFGRIIEIDYRLVIPDESRTLEDGAIRAFEGEVYSESQRDLMRACRANKVRTNVPWCQLSEEERHFVIEGEPDYGSPGKQWPQAWYGIRRFFNWLESSTYKMHVRVFLSKYRAYVSCPDCGATRLQPEALNWKWRGQTLPSLYQLPVGDLLPLMEEAIRETGNKQVDIAGDAILARLRYLDQVGLGYITLDRSSRSLSGGETQRVNLTSCLGTALTDTLFVLDEPSIGLHSRDIDRLIRILRRLTQLGNTVVVVEHDESVIRAADLVIELGPEPGTKGGHITALGSHRQLARLKAGRSITADYLNGRNSIETPAARRPVDPAQGRWMRIYGARKHNLRGMDVSIPLQVLVGLSGVSGSGKSTLMDNVIYQGLMARSGKAVEDPAEVREITGAAGFAEIVRVDQTPVTRTPRSNPVLYVDAWDTIRQLFARTEEAQSAGMTVSFFSFNAGPGRCSHCEGLGYERVEMQFMADLFIPCPICDGRRFKPDVLEIVWNGMSVHDVLQMTVDEAVVFFSDIRKVRHCLQALQDVGLGYLKLGQPLNTLSGGESQRLKLVKYLTQIDDSVAKSLILLDEPTTGLHTHDVKRLITVLQRLTDHGHSIVLIEHQLDVLKSCDWIIELGPGAGAAGGEIVFTGTPEDLVASKTETAAYLGARMGDTNALAMVAETNVRPERAGAFSNGRKRNGRVLQVMGAREHNLDDIHVDIPHRAFTVVTGVSGSGKSTLAFDIIFAEGQRRFMESMSAWARQYVEQLPRPDIDALYGIPPSVAIEQRVSRGSRKSTVATVTEVAQYLRLLYARVGVPCHPNTGEALITLSPEAVVARVEAHLDALLKPAQGHELVHLCAPIIRGRKGHHQPLANWARDRGYQWMRCDGTWTKTDSFKKLDRFREHDVEVAIAAFSKSRGRKNWQVATPLEDASLPAVVAHALRLGKGACFLVDTAGTVLHRYSTARVDPETGEAFPELDPKHFSWNSARGWCPVCRGHGTIAAWMSEDERFDQLPGRFKPGETCPACHGQRLSRISRSVFLTLQGGDRLSLPDLLALPPGELLETLERVETDRRGEAILAELKPEIHERLRFLGQVGLDYLTLDRSAETLSGGESQRIRLAAQLGSNLSGVLYVLDEPSIGLHARDNTRLLDSLTRLRDKGNTLLVVEHDDETMRRADRILDLGPGAGIHGGKVVANGSYARIVKNRSSLTARYLSRGIHHPLRGQYRPTPPPFHPRRKSAPQDWIVLDEPRLRNLKGGRVSFAKERLNVVCGVSGAGKSTLVRDLLIPSVTAAIKGAKASLSGSKLDLPLNFLRFGENFRTVIEVDQDPIGKTPRSTPATYIGAFDLIRSFFATLPEAKIHGYTPSTFSFNTKGGRCENCKGAGRVKLEMSFMPEAYVDCEACGGSRFGPELDEVRWNGKNIAEVLALSFEEAAAFLDFHPRLKQMLDLMLETGLGYLTLGQSSPSLSGGEAQRLKMVSELAKGLGSMSAQMNVRFQPNLYVLEEPTIGLHLSDCERLIELLHRLVDQGHTVVVIEHHLDVIREADHVIELGPDGGERGGRILYQGPVAGLAEVAGSPTGAFLKAPPFQA